MNVIERIVKCPFIPGDHKTLAGVLFTIDPVLNARLNYKSTGYFAKDGELVAFTANKSYPRLELDGLSVDAMISETRKQFPKFSVDDSFILWVDIYTGPQPPMKMGELFSFPAA